MYGGAKCKLPRACAVRIITLLAYPCYVILWGSAYIWDRHCKPLSYLWSHKAG